MRKSQRRQVSLRKPLRTHSRLWLKMMIFALDSKVLTAASSGKKNDESKEKKPNGGSEEKYLCRVGHKLSLTLHDVISN